MAATFVSRSPVSLQSSGLSDMDANEVPDREADVSGPTTAQHMQYVSSSSQIPTLNIRPNIDAHEVPELCRTQGMDDLQENRLDHVETSSPGSLSAPGTATESDSETSSQEFYVRRRPFPPSKSSTGLSSKPFTTRLHVGVSNGAERISIPSPRERVLNFQSSAGSEASENSSSPSPADQLQVLWTKLEDQRENNRDHRRKMAAKRVEARSIQRKKDDADNEFMQFLRPLLLDTRILPRPYEALERRLNRLQTLRDDYNAAMSAYEAMEDELDQEETELENLETRFFSTLYGVSREDDQNNRSAADDNDVEEEVDRPPSRTSLLGISGELEEDIHPLYRNLLDAVGDHDLAQEHYTDLVTHRDSILYDLEMTLKLSRLRHAQGRASDGSAILSEKELEGLKSTVAHIPPNISGAELKDLFGNNISEPDLNFLMDFNREEKAARQHLNEAVMEVRRLRDLCKAKGAMRKHPPYHEEYTIFIAADDGSSPPPTNMAIHHHPLTAMEDGLAHPDFPILLSNPSHVLGLDTTTEALRKAVNLSQEDPSRAQLMAQMMKEYDIATLLGEARAQDKSDYINRWLLQKLRLSPLEVRSFLSTWPSRLKIVNIRRWQEDVLYYWTRDEAANQPAYIFDGPKTSDDDYVLQQPAESVHNSEIELPLHTRSEEGDAHSQHENPRDATRSVV